MRLRLREHILYGLLRWWFVGDSRRPDANELGTAAIERILVFSNTAIGDTLMSIPALNFLREQYSDAQIVLVVHPAYAALFSSLVGHVVSRLVTYDGRWQGFFKVIGQCRSFRPDLALMLHSNEPQATPISYLSGARWRFKLPNVHRFSFLLSNEFPKRRWEDFAHGVTARLASAYLATGGRLKQFEQAMPPFFDGLPAVASSGGQFLARETHSLDTQHIQHAQASPFPSNGQFSGGQFFVREDQTFEPVFRMDLPVSMGHVLEVEHFLSERGIDEFATVIAFQAGASTVSRRWSVASFQALARRLLKQLPNAFIVMTGSPAERALTESIVQGVNHSRILTVAGELALEKLPALLQRCSVLVAPDTGTMHLAVSVGTPVVALFAVSDWRRSGPYQDLSRHIILQKWRTCSPCFSKRCPHAKPPCMELISVDEVEMGVLTILSREAADARTSVFD